MGDLDRIEEKIDWLVKAVKTMLTAQSGWVNESPLRDYVEDEPEPEPPPTLSPPVQAVCTHQHQQRVGNSIVCAKCGFELIKGAGVVGQDPGATIARKREPQ